MKVSKGQSQPEIVAAAFPILYMVLCSPFLYQVLIVTHFGPFKHRRKLAMLALNSPQSSSLGGWAGFRDRSFQS